MSATKNASGATGGFATGPETIPEGLAKSVLAPRKVIEANLKAGSSALNFASHRMRAQAELLDRFLRCDSVEQAAAVQKDFFEEMIGDYSREMNEMMDIAREVSVLLAPAPNGAMRTSQAG
jgi:hypothetical protein